MLQKFNDEKLQPSSTVNERITYQPSLPSSMDRLDGVGQPRAGEVAVRCPDANREPGEGQGNSP